MKDNVITVVTALIISVPICIGAYKSQSPEPVSVERVTRSAEVVARESEVIPVTEIQAPEIVRTELGEFTITAYCPCAKCCGEWADGITYTGTVATEGRTIAVDPGVIPLGSVVEINGVEYVAEDIGGAIDGNHIDIYFNDHNDALVWGVQDLKVCLVEEARYE